MTRPDWLKIGAVVRVQFWCGIVRDVADTDTGKLFVWVYGPKNAAYGQRLEVLEFDAQHIRPATDAEILADCRAYYDRAMKLMNATDEICEEIRP